MRALVVTWAPGGNLPPMLSVAALLRDRGHDVALLASAHTHRSAQELGVPVLRYARAVDPDPRVAFEHQAPAVMAVIAGPALAFDVRDAVAQLRPDLAIVDCMLPGAIAGARAAGTRVVSLVHFLYGHARTQMLRSGGGWTTDLERLAVTHERLGLAPARDGIDAWEAPQLVLVTAPRWFDIEAGAPDHVVYAGPLGVRTGPHTGTRVLLTFSTTVMDGQLDLIERACAAVSGFDPILTLGPAVEAETVRVPAGVEVLAAADHDALLRGCEAVIGHGGLGTVLRALAHGVPQLVLPLGRDQAINANRIAQLGAGIWLDAQAPPEEIRAALRVLTAEPRFRAAAVAAAERIAAAEPERSAAEILERL